MSTATLPAPSLARERWEGAVRRMRRLRELAKMQAVPRIKARSRASARHIGENAYTLAGLVCFDAAGFVHSTFAGLIVTGASWFALELKTKGT